MSTPSSESPQVPVEILPPLPADAASAAGRPLPVVTETPPLKGWGTFYHPASGVVILGLDWLIFGTDLLTGFVALPVMCLLAFLFSFGLLVAIQRKWANNTLPASLGKAFIGAVLVAVPFPITGTMLGAAILALSGLPHHPVDMVKKLAASNRSLT